jgi:hypothetical protein
MISDKEVLQTLQRLGGRLRRTHIHRRDTMEKFAVRLGVSVPPLRALEKVRRLPHWDSSRMRCHSCIDSMIC